VKIGQYLAKIWYMDKSIVSPYLTHGVNVKNVFTFFIPAAF